MSWSRPGRSALLGMIAAATGIERSDESTHRTLERELHVAIRTHSPGRPLNDYHTTQTPKARRKSKFKTRKNELEEPTLHTIISTREWRVDAYFSIAFWLRNQDSTDLNKIFDGLTHPNFVLYIGRKSAPPGLPLNLSIIKAHDFMEAFEQRVPNEVESEILELIAGKDTKSMGTTIAVDSDVEIPDARDSRIERRRDSIASRTRWQFTDRLERVIDLRQ